MWIRLGDAHKKVIVKHEDMSSKWSIIDVSLNTMEDIHDAVKDKTYNVKVNDNEIVFIKQQ